jgi:hypothetical protein
VSQSHLTLESVLIFGASIKIFNARILILIRSSLHQKL